MKFFFRWLPFFSILIVFHSCKNNASSIKTQSPNFIEFVNNFDTLKFPVILSYPNFLKENVFQFQNLRKINPKDMLEFMKMDSTIPYPVYYYGQLPMLDSTYYLINYFEIKDKNNPSMWWTLMKFNYFGELKSETNISYCLKDSDIIDERFCKIISNYQCFYLESKGHWDEKTRTIKDTILTTRTINLSYDPLR